MRVVILRSVLETYTPRALKIAQALNGAGNEVLVLAWDREAKCPGVEKKDGYTGHRCRLKAPYGKKLLFYLPLWWIYIFYFLLKERWDVVHSFDYDTIIPAFFAAKIKRKPIVYEIADVYVDIVPLPKMVRNIFIKIDKIFMHFSNAIIIPGEGMIEQLQGIPNRNVVVIYNSPPDEFQELAIANQVKRCFTIFFAGALFKGRLSNIDKVYYALKEIDNVKLILAGYGDQVEDIMKWVQEEPDKLQFIGRISYSEVIKETILSDLLVSIYSPSLLNSKYTLPNKIFEAMMCAKPILVSKDTMAANIIEKENCGLVVDCEQVQEIRRAITCLRDDPMLCKRLGENGKKAYDKKYSWDIIKKRLLTLYDMIAQDKRSKGEQKC